MYRRGPLMRVFVGCHLRKTSVNLDQRRMVSIECNMGGHYYVEISHRRLLR